MIFPTKHTNIEQSLLGFGSYILQIMENGTTVDYLWQEYLKDFNSKKYSAKHSFDNMLLTLVFLHSVNAIKEDNGELKKCN